MGKPAKWLLLFNALVVALVTVFKFTGKHIAPIFLLQGLSHYSAFLIFVILIKFGDHPKLQKAS